LVNPEINFLFLLSNCFSSQLMHITIPTLNFWNLKIIKTEMLDQLLPLPFLSETACLLQMLGIPELLYAGVEMVRLVVLYRKFLLSCTDCITDIVSQ